MTESPIPGGGSPEQGNNQPRPQPRQLTEEEKRQLAALNVASQATQAQASQGLEDTWDPYRKDPAPPAPAEEIGVSTVPPELAVDAIQSNSQQNYQQPAFTDPGFGQEMPVQSQSQMETAAHPAAVNQFAQQLSQPIQQEVKQAAPPPVVPADNGALALAQSAAQQFLQQAGAAPPSLPPAQPAANPAPAPAPAAPIPPSQFNPQAFFKQPAAQPSPQATAPQAPPSVVQPSAQPVAQSIPESIPPAPAPQAMAQAPTFAQPVLQQPQMAPPPEQQYQAPQFAAPPAQEAPVDMHTDALPFIPQASNVAPPAIPQTPGAASGGAVAFPFQQAMTGQAPPNAQPLGGTQGAEYSQVADQLREQQLKLRESEQAQGKPTAELTKFVANQKSGGGSPSSDMPKNWVRAKTENPDDGASRPLKRSDFQTGASRGGKAAAKPAQPTPPPKPSKPEPPKFSAPALAFDEDDELAITPSSSPNPTPTSGGSGSGMEQNMVEDAINDFKALFLSPHTFFTDYFKEDQPIKGAATVLAIAVIINAIGSTIFHLGSGLIALKFIFQIPIGEAIIVGGSSWLAYFFFNKAGGRGSLKDTFRVLAYANASLIVGWLNPGIGIGYLVSTVFTLIMSVLGLGQIHQLDIKKTILITAGVSVMASVIEAFVIN